MNSTDFLILLIHASGGIRGRTLLQKRAFFVAQLAGLSFDEDFVAHYYGPYSPPLDTAITHLKTLGLVEERMTGFGASGTSGFEMRRFDYQLTEDGESIAESLKVKYAQDYQAVLDSLERIEAAGNPNYFELSIAAKAYYILKKKDRAMNRKEIIAAATSFDWNIQPDSLERAVSFLEKVGLAQSA